MSRELSSYRFADIHPDPCTAREVVIDTLLGALCEAQRALSGADALNLATPQGLVITRNLRNAAENAAKSLAWRGPGEQRFMSDETEATRHE